MNSMAPVIDFNKRTNELNATIKKRRKNAPNLVCMYKWTKKNKQNVQGYDRKHCSSSRRLLKRLIRLKCDLTSAQCMHTRFFCSALLIACRTNRINRFINEQIRINKRYPNYNVIFTFKCQEFKVRFVFISLDILFLYYVLPTSVFLTI